MPLQSFAHPISKAPEWATHFRVIPGEPLPTSFGEDLYRRIFGAPLTSPKQVMPPRT